LKKFCDFKISEDARGSITAFNSIEPVVTKRFFLIDCLRGQWRGDHYHKLTNQTVYVIEGEIEVRVTTPETKKSFLMGVGDSYLQCAYQKFEFMSVSNSSRLLVLCDREHDKKDYYTEF